MPTLYGLTKCDTCRKARNWLERFEIPHEFVDYREQRVPAPTLKDWATQLGGWEHLVNRSGTTWRGLPPTRKAPAGDPEWQLLLKEYPQLIRRPLAVAGDGSVSVGFTDSLFKRRFLHG